tara:strand:+ start:244 stop:447 length:204 start_codon:yes stop_codon:yes gene_type:complete
MGNKDGFYTKYGYRIKDFVYTISGSMDNLVGNRRWKLNGNWEKLRDVVLGMGSIVLIIFIMGWLARL